MVKHGQWFGLWAVLFLLLSLFLQPNKAVAGIHVSSKTVELGKPVRVVVRGEESVTFFQQQLVAHFAADFFLDYQLEQTDMLRVWLYPYHSGQFFVPAYSGKTDSWTQIDLSVVPNQAIVVDWKTVKSAGFVSQLVDFAFRVRVPDSAWRVEMLEPSLSSTFKQQWHYQSVPLQRLDSGLLSAQKLYQGGATFEYLGIVEPFKSQLVSLPAPYIKVRSPGGSQWYFYRPSAAYQLMPLPSFLPLSLLVAKPSLEQKFQPENLVLGAVNYWQWTIQTEGASKAYLQAFSEQILQPLQQINSVEWLAPEKRFSETLSLKQQSFEQVYTLILPFRPQTWLWQQPELSLRYFDPQTEKLTVLTIPSQWHLSLPRWLLVLMQLLAAGGMVLLVGVAIYIGRFYFYHLRLHRALGVASHIDMTKAEANSVQDMVVALFVWRTAVSDNRAFAMFKPSRFGAQNEVCLEVKSLQSWLDWYSKNTQKDSARDAAKQMVRLLEQRLYAFNRTDVVSENKAELVLAIKRWQSSESLLSQWRWLRIQRKNPKGFSQNKN